MPTKVSVNSGQITINDGSTFLVTDSYGWIDDNLPQGFFVNDTRLISYYETSINRDRLLLLAASPLNYHSALYQFTNPTLRTVNGVLPQGQVMVTIRRDIGCGMHEDIDIKNHYSKPVKFQLMLAIRSDFADIFEVKSKQVLTRGETETTWNEGKLTTVYQNGGFYRSLITQPFQASSQPRYANGRLFFDVALEPGESWHTCINFIAIAGDEINSPEQTCRVPHQTEAKQVSEAFLAHFRFELAAATRVKTFSAKEFATVSCAQWRQVRAELKVHQRKRDQQRCFRRDPESYLSELETRFLQLALPR